MSAGLFWAPSGNYALALGLYGLGFISFSTGMVFYDALLPSVTEPRRFERVSSFAVGIGYLGGGTLFAGNIWMAQHPEWFGFLGVESSVKTAFLMVAVWWFLFTLPLLYFVKEKAPAQKIPYVAAMKVSLSQLRDTFHEIKKLHIVMRFLVAYWLYIDGVDTIIQMAVDYALSVGFDSSGLMKALLITQFVGVPATLIYGRLGERYGAKTAILSGLLIYAVVVVWGAVMTEPWEFYGIAVIVGLVQGGVQALSRALFAHLIPLEKAGEFFGFMNLLSKFAAVLGPMLVGTVSHFTGEPRLSMLSLLILFALGAVLLQGVTVSSSKEKGH